MDVNFELYKIFYYVAKYLSFSEASTKLFISQSAVSQSIKILEEKMNCKLLFRSTKNVRLTSEGEVLFEHVEQAFNFIKAGERSLDEMHSMMQGEVRIGASDTICKYYLLPYLKKFNQIYPHIKIHVTNRTSPKCIELLKKGSVDFSVINIPSKYSYTDMTVNVIKSIQDVFIAGNNYSHLKDKEICLKDLERYPLLMLEKNSITREFFDTYLKSNGADIVPEIELGSIDLLIELTKIGLGISFVMTDSIKKELSGNDIFIINVKERIPPRNLGIITHNNISTPVAVQKFIELLK
jgi:DNA-binding transcriptional LysR family regulator